MNETSDTTRTETASGTSSGVSLSGIHVYPIKSAGGVALQTAEVDERGLRHDRRWMLVDGRGQFLSQRESPRLALVRVRIGADRLLVDAPEMPTLAVPFESGSGGEAFTTEVWGDAVRVVTVGGGADRWFSEFLRVSCRLVHQPDDSVRGVDQDYGGPEDQAGLADGFAFLLVSEPSLADLNVRLSEPLPMDRFRPNLVVRGCEAYAEDGWSGVRVGGLPFRVVKPCARCVIITVDQSTAATGKEPLRTLARYRKVGGKILFGQNLAHDALGILRVGDPVEIFPTRP